MLENFKLNKEMENKLQKYMKLVLETNEKMNLTAITDEKEFIEKHFYDSLLPSKIFDFENKKILDVGSGAGFPGIPLAIAFPSSHFVLLDPLNKRCNFLNNVIKELDLKNVEVICKRAEDIFNEERESFDLVVSRAVSVLNILLELTIPYLKVNGTAIFYKGLKYQQEIDLSKNALKELDCEVINIQKEILPFSKEERFNIILKKLKVTKEKFPRDFSQIKKKPL